MPSKIETKVGQRFGDWRIVAVDHEGKVWAQCKCGLVKTVDPRELRAGRSTACKSCGQKK